MIIARFAVKSMTHNVMNVQLIEQGVSVLGRAGSEAGMQKRGGKHWIYLRHRGGENYDFIQFADAAHELVDARALDDIDIVELTFDFNRYGEVSLMKDLDIISGTYYLLLLS